MSKRGVLSGEIRINVDYDMKGDIVRAMLKDLGLAFDEASAIGDGEGDKGMFEAVGLPIAFNINGGSANFPAAPGISKNCEKQNTCWGLR